MSLAPPAAWTPSTVARMPLPPLLFSPDPLHRTTSPSRNCNSLLPAHLLPWTGFRRRVLDTVSPLLSAVPAHSLLPSAPVLCENFIVGNEAGVVGRYVQNVGHVVNEIIQQLVRFHRPQDSQVTCFADAQVASIGLAHRISDLAGETESGSRRLPDLALVRVGPALLDGAVGGGDVLPAGRRDGDQRDVLAAVGEVKTPWTTSYLDFDPSDPAIPDAERRRRWTVLARNLGQLARYMDDTNMRHGFYTNYNVTVFLARASEFQFYISPPIRWDDQNENPSLRMCFIALGWWVEDEMLRRFPTRVGMSLTCPVTVSHRTQATQLTTHLIQPPNSAASFTIPYSTQSDRGRSEAPLSSDSSENSDLDNSSSSSSSLSSIPSDNHCSVKLYPKGVIHFSIDSKSDSFPPGVDSLSVCDVLSRSNQKLVVVARHSCMSGFIIAKIRLNRCPESYQSHTHECLILTLLSTSPFFPHFLASGKTQDSHPIILMTFIPFPSFLSYSSPPTSYAKKEQLEEQLKHSLHTALTHLHDRGLEHIDLAARNVLFDSDTGRVWVVDLEDVVDMPEPPYAYSRESLKYIVDEFWKWEVEQWSSSIKVYGADVTNTKEDDTAPLEDQ